MGSEDTLENTWSCQLAENLPGEYVVWGDTIADFIAALQAYRRLITKWPDDKTTLFSQCDNIRRLINEGADVNAKNEQGVPALLLAISCWMASVRYADVDTGEKTLDIIYDFLAQGANPNVQDQDGLTPLHLAILEQSIPTKLIRALVDAGAYINQPGNRSPLWPETPLVVAIMFERVEAVKFLIELGADVNFSWRGLSPLIAELRTSRDLFPNRISAIATILLEHGADFKTDQGKILASAISYTPESVEHFLNQYYGGSQYGVSDHDDGDHSMEAQVHSVATATQVLLRPLIDDLTGHQREEESICSSCREFELKALHRKWFLHSPDSQMLYRSMFSGCALCRLIKDCLPASFGEVSLYYYSALSESDTMTRNYFERIIVRGQGTDSFHYGELRLAAVDDDTASILSRVRGLQDQGTDSESAFQLASHWIKTCLDHHGSSCHVFGDELPPLPTRVIDVGAGDGPEEPRLIVSNGQKGHYTTLSYCWGDTPNLRTEAHTLESFTKVIPFKRIPKTIREAIMTTRRLGIQYLWVDTLCILQDSPEDWLFEAGNMASVYKNSLLTIAATDSIDSEGGLFRERKRLRTRPVRFAPHLVPSGLGKPESIYVFGDRQETNDAFRRESRLDTRGWVLQEQLLSPRTLNLSSQELYWDCPGLSASESYPAGIPRDHDRNFERRHFRELKSILLDTSHDVDRERIHMLWQRMLVLYSKRHLSKQTDRLVALAGAAKQISIRLNDNLLAGLWVKWLWRDLLWWIDRPKDSAFQESELKAWEQSPNVPSMPEGAVGKTTQFKTPDARECQAPSWSWVSIKGPISYAFPSGTSHLKYYPCLQVLSHTERSLSESKGAAESITVRGLLFQMDWIQGKLETICRQRAARPSDSDLIDARASWSTEGTKANSIPKHLAWKPDTEDTDGKTITCLVVASSHEFIVALGLIAIDEGENVYKRVGLVYWNTYYYSVPEEVEYQVLTLR